MHYFFRMEDCCAAAAAFFCWSLLFDFACFCEFFFCVDLGDLSPILDFVLLQLAIFK